MSTGRLDDLGSADPGLDRLFSVLTAGGTPDELAGESAARAMFRANPPQFRASPPQPAAPARWRRRRVVRLAVPVLALAGALIAGAYTAEFPAPIQQVAYRILGFAGVPEVHRPAPRAPARHDRAAGSGGAGHPVLVAPRSGNSVQRSAPPGVPRRAAPARLSLSVARHRIVAGGSDSLAGRLAGGQAGQRLTLLEQPAGRTGWRPAGHASTSPAGRAALTVRNLTRNSAFRLAGPGGNYSPVVRVIVVPPVLITVASGQRPQATAVTASSPLAVPADLVLLQRWTGTRWQTLRAERLNQSDQAVFQVSAVFRVSAGPVRQVYRVVLPATGSHGRSGSRPVVIMASGLAASGRIAAQRAPRPPASPSAASTKTAAARLWPARVRSASPRPWAR